MPIGWCPERGAPEPERSELAWLRGQGLRPGRSLLRHEDAPPHAGTLLSPGLHRIGRDAGCAWVIPLRCVSRRHFEVEVLPTRGVLLRDLGSTNGTWLDHRPLVEAALEHAALLGIGPLRLLLRPAQAGPGSVAEAQFADAPVER